MFEASGRGNSGSMVLVQKEVALCTLGVVRHSLVWTWLEKERDYLLKNDVGKHWRELQLHEGNKESVANDCIEAFIAMRRGMCAHCESGEA